MSTNSTPANEIPIPGVPGVVTALARRAHRAARAAAAQAGPGRAGDASAPPARRPARPRSRTAQSGAFLTTAQGARLHDTDHSLKAGAARTERCCRTTTCARRSPTSTTSGSPSAWSTHAAPPPTACSRPTARRRAVTKAGFLAKDVETPVFVRFSTVLGSRGSADTVRDTRGFATKFYTDEGTFDLVGNNIPVFFIQDGIKFPDVIHAGKPHPDREIPQAQSAHDTFWDFVSLHTEAHAPHDVEHVRPRHPALVPDDGGLRRPHLPAGQRRRRDDAGEVPLEAEGSACTPWSGRRRS